VTESKPIRIRTSLIDAAVKRHKCKPGKAVRLVLEAALAPVRAEAGEAGSEGGR